MTRAPVLSVCIPTYRRDAFLKPALRHWLHGLAALEGRAELVVGDNAGETTVRDLVTTAGTALPSEVVRYVGHPENRHFNGNVLSLVRDHAQGTHVWICGDDDFVHPGGLEKIVLELERHPGLLYAYINSRFIPGEFCTPEELSRAETSPHAVLENRDLRDRSLDEAAAIIPLDRGCFTGIYSSVWQREEAVAAFEGTERLPAFESLRGTFPHAVHIVQRLLRRPCLYFGEPLLTVSHAVSYSSAGTSMSLLWLPRLYDLLEKEGIPRRILDPYRRRLIRRSGQRLARILREKREGAPHAQAFSLPRFVADNLRFAELYPSLLALPFTPPGPRA